jgi:biotin operon repressor
MKKTQTSDILQHLKDGRRLTQKEAINQYGAYRLSSIIHSLRKKGYNIESKPSSVPTRYKKSDGTPRLANIVEYTI